MGALVFGSVRSSLRWFVLFAVVFLASGILGEVTGGLGALPRWFNTTMIALNVVVGGAVVFTLLAVFAKQAKDAQEVTDNLLINVLPRSLAERMKAEPQTIADSSSSASILFADIANFTPMSANLKPAELVGMLDQLFGT